MIRLILLTVLLSGCATPDGEFQRLIETVKDNCHTTIDAQINGGLTGLGGQGHFTQECWPTKPVTTEVTSNG